MSSLAFEILADRRDKHILKFVKKCIEGKAPQFFSNYFKSKYDIPLLSSACVQPLSGANIKMPIVKGRVARKTVNVLRDTGCSGIVVKKNLVTKEQYTGTTALCY